MTIYSIKTRYKMCTIVLNLVEVMLKIFVMYVSSIINLSVNTFMLYTCSIYGSI